MYYNIYNPQTYTQAYTQTVVAGVRELQPSFPLGFCGITIFRKDFTSNR